jgi:hypothetical protein
MAKKISEMEKRFPTLRVFPVEAFAPNTDTPPMPSCIVRWKTEKFVVFALYINNQLRETDHISRGYKPAKR